MPSHSRNQQSTASEATRRRFVIDTDTASDDAVALLMAVAAGVENEAVEIVAVTVVAGNVPLDTAINNAIVTLDVCGAPHVPVYAGAAAPLVRPLETSEETHGVDGMAGVALPPPSRAPDAGDAIDVLLALADEAPGTMTLVTIGPLTNVARAIQQDPDFLTKFEHTYFMAGSPDGVGNVNVAGEFNVWADPEAATIVFAADGPKTMVGWNISRKFTVITPEENAALVAAGPLGAWASAINVDVDRFCREVSGLDGYDLPDPVTMAVALDPTLITEATDESMVIGLDEPTRGAVVLDRRAERSEPNCRVVWAIDEARFKQLLLEACALERPTAH